MLFDTMSSVLGSENKYKDNKNHISSESYNRNSNELKTLHEKKMFRDMKK